MLSSSKVFQFDFGYGLTFIKFPAIANAKTLAVIVKQNHTGFSKANEMINLDPIIAVKDVEASAKWYEQVFGFKKAHGGKDFAVLVSENGNIILCLHKWVEHQHPSLKDPFIAAGNGLILYFRTDKMEVIRKNIDGIDCIIEEDIHLNPNSLKNEFSLRDPNGYFLTITEYHTY